MARRKKRKAKGAPRAATERSSESAGGKTGDERPPAPWGNFPLTQLSVLAGLVLIVIGLIAGDPALLLGGLLLGSLGGLELSIREHFAGYRSHTTLLAAVGAVAVALVTWFVIGLPFAVSVGLAAGAFVLLFLVLRQAFIRASGGLSYKIR
ncbi:MAG: hypothetical protein ACKOQ5_06550 [Solirubrobacterales bacterium]